VADRHNSKGEEVQIEIGAHGPVMLQEDKSSLKERVKRITKYRAESRAAGGDLTGPNPIDDLVYLRIDLRSISDRQAGQMSLGGCGG